MPGSLRGWIGTGDLPERFLSAAELKWSRTTLYRKMQRYGIASEPNFDSVCAAPG